jgi:heme oxygenase (biliverdin-IX-beta and delta-forming)
MPAPALLQALRAHTAHDHAALEAEADVMARLDGGGRQTKLVAAFWRMHEAAERALAPWLAAVGDLNLVERRRSDRIERDLRALGGEPPLPVAPPQLRSCGEALGLLYVVEGSSLGGRTILRDLRSQNKSLHGLSFFDPYGDSVGDRWRDLIAVMEREVSTGAAATADVLTGAALGFRFCRDVLMETDHP